MAVTCTPCTVGLFPFLAFVGTSGDVARVLYTFTGMPRWRTAVLCFRPVNGKGGRLHIADVFVLPVDAQRLLFHALVLCSRPPSSPLLFFIVSHFLVRTTRSTAVATFQPGFVYAEAVMTPSSSVRAGPYGS